MDAFTAALDPPMFVVTARSGMTKSGCLVAFATQCSARPTRFLVCLSKLNHTYGVARETTALGVHLLGEQQQQLAELFGTKTGDDIDKFARCSFHDGKAGVPILEDCAAFLEGQIELRIDFGDHVGFVLSPIDSGRPSIGEREMLMDEVDDLMPGHPLGEENDR